LEVTVLNRQRGHRVSASALQRFVRGLTETLPAGDADSLAIKLVSDRKMREYNRTFRGRDSTTDVLSFPARSDEQPAGERHLGDIVIAVSTAAVQTRETGRALSAELSVLALHGYLHLLGYDHTTDDGTMMRLQGRLERRLLGAVPRGKSS
jgi:probable rRNA maturation factor